MLIPQRILDQIQTGHVTLAFRRWKKPSVKEGTRMKTGIGELEILGIEEVAEDSMTEAEARAAGFADLAALRKELRGREGTLYRIQLRYAGEDSRIALRENADLGAEEWAELDARLARLDAASKTGPWTQRVLRAIQAHPNLAAVELAKVTGDEKEWLKLNVRKLKNLGLTISHHPGYTLSPRGERYLEKSGG